MKIGHLPWWNLCEFSTVVQMLVNDSYELISGEKPFTGILSNPGCLFTRLTWYGNVNSKNRTKLAPIVDIATKLIGREQNQLSRLLHNIPR